MGTDNLFHKRKEKSTEDLARRRARRDSYDRILIVCEGSKTEPNYFHGLRNSLRLTTANVEITGDSDPNPASVVAFAEKLCSDEKKTDLPFDHVFCVFDKDNHSDYQAAVSQIENMKPKGVFHGITSVPAFEYFLLLHYTYSTRPCNSAEVLSALNKCIKNYRKGNKNIFSIVEDHLETAKTNAAKSLKAAHQSGTDNPSTQAHILVDFMQKIR